jgi:hypothetical protein
MEFRKPIDDVIICASGKGTRLFPLTKYIPKYLVNPDNFNLLTHIVNYWNSYTNNITIIIEEKYNTITDYYLKGLNISYKIINVDIHNQGNAYTLYNALKTDYDHKKVLITWCDIFPSVDIPHSVFKDNIIFTHGNQCRYNYENNLIKKKEDGNIIGIYYFNDYISMKYEDEKDDIIDMIQKYCSTHNSFNITELSDIGEMNKMLDFEKKNVSEYETRYYNKITQVGHNLLKKECAHPVGKDIIYGEINFYRSIQKFNLTCFPKIYEIEDTYFVMEKINGVVLKTLNIDNYIELFIETLKTLHKTSIREVSKDTLLNDLNYEFNIKIKQHIESIKPLSNHFNYITHINGVQISMYHINSIIDDLYNKVKDTHVNPEKDVYQYSLIHADAHFSNTMVESNRIVFIDPYGRFGHSMLYGSTYFDYCLILFSLTGFDEFSSLKKYYFDIEDTNIKLNITVKDIEKYKPFFLKHRIDFNTCLRMCILHWFKFTFYTSNHILKSVASYYHALYLYHKYIL